MKNTLLKFSPTSFLKIYLDIKFFFNNLFNNYISNDKKFVDFRIKDSNIFFGYHDKINCFENKILFHENFKKNFYVGYIYKNKFYRLKKTELCSWQLGSQLQWISQKKIIFNCYENNKPKSVVYDILSKSKFKTYNYLIYNLCNQKKKFVSLDFNKLYIYRKWYGYKLKGKKNFNISLNDTLKIVDLKNGKILHEISNDLVCKKIKKKKNQHMYFNHATFSPSGDVILFFLIDGANISREIYVILYHLKKKKIQYIKKIKNISHYCWLDNKNIIYTSLKKNYKCDYMIYNFHKKKNLKLGLNIKIDGHPMINPKKKNLVLTDTYPNKFGFQKLIVFDLLKKKIIWQTDLKFSTHFLFGERCDLHPKWSDDGKKIVVDYAIKNQRLVRSYDFP